MTLENKFVLLEDKLDRKLTVIEFNKIGKPVQNKVFTRVEKQLEALIK